MGADGIDAAVGNGGSATEGAIAGAGGGVAAADLAAEGFYRAYVAAPKDLPPLGSLFLVVFVPTLLAFALIVAVQWEAIVAHSKEKKAQKKLEAQLLSQPIAEEDRVWPAGPPEATLTELERLVLRYEKRVAMGLPLRGEVQRSPSMGAGPGRGRTELSRSIAKPLGPLSPKAKGAKRPDQPFGGPDGPAAATPDRPFDGASATASAEKKR